MKNRSSLLKIPVLVLVPCILATTFMSCKKNAADSARWIIVKQGAGMREAPNANGNLIAVVPYAAKVEILAEKSDPVTIAGSIGKWTEVKWNAKKGWVFGCFLGDADPAAPGAGVDDRSPMAAEPGLVAAIEQYRRKLAASKWVDNNVQLAKELKHEIRISSVEGNFAIVTRDFDYPGILEYNSEGKSETLWVKKAGEWKVIIEDESEYGQKIKLTNLNNDGLADVMIEIKHGTTYEFTFYLGNNASTVEKVDSIITYDYPSVSLGQCEKTRIVGFESRPSDDIKSKVPIVAYIFDCATNRIRKTNP